MKKIVSLLLAAVMALTMAACGTQDTQNTENTNNTEAEVQSEKTAEESEEAETPALTEADPQTALEEIYALQERSGGLVDATDEIMTDVMGFDLELIEEYYVRYMETDFGCSDVYIIKAAEDQQEAVRQAMKNWQESRIRAFNGYDIYDSSSISENGVIFQRGEYLVLLMLEDNDAARAVIEQYIPETLDLDD